MDVHQIKKDERVCYNCVHMLWMVGIGQGVRCGFKTEEQKIPPMIPHLRHTCDKFENKFEKVIDNEKQS